MDILGDLFGYDPATPEERAAARQRAIREGQYDHIIRDGKVYMNTDELTYAFASVSQLLKLRGALLGDVNSLALGAGLDIAVNVIGEAASELLRRQADAIFNSDN